MYNMHVLYVYIPLYIYIYICVCVCVCGWVGGYVCVCLWIEMYQVCVKLGAAALSEALNFAPTLDGCTESTSSRRQPLT